MYPVYSVTYLSGLNLPHPLPTTHGMVPYWVVGRGSGMEQPGAPLKEDDAPSSAGAP